jgi:MFS family permease
VALLRMLPAAVASPVLSAYADRMRREQVLAAIAAIRAVAIGAAALVLHAGGSTTVVYALAIVATIAFNVFRPAHSALLPALCTSTHKLTSANVVRGVLDAGGALVGPALAGVLLAVGSATTVFAAGALLCLGAVGVLVRIRYEAPAAPHAAARKALVCDAVEGVRAAAGHRDLRLIFGLGFAQTFVRGALNVLAIAVAFEVLGTDDPGVATLWVAVGAGGVVGSFAVSLLVGSRHLGAWLGVALVLWGLPIALIGCPRRRWRSPCSPSSGWGTPSPTCPSTPCPYAWRPTPCSPACSASSRRSSRPGSPWAPSSRRPSSTPPASARRWSSWG